MHEYVAHSVHVSGSLSHVATTAQLSQLYAGFSIDGFTNFVEASVVDKRSRWHMQLGRHHALPF